MATQILMPALSPTMEEGKLTKWLVKEGDEVKSGDILAEIETDKATMEFEAVDEGTIGKILVSEGTEGVKVNAPIATLIGEGEDAKAPVDISSAMASIKDAVSAETKGSKPAPAPPLTPALPPKGGEGVSPSSTLAPAERGRGQGEGLSKSAPNGGDRIFASPLARRIAQQKGIDIAGLRGSGPRGRIVKSDVEGAKPGAQKSAASAAPRTEAGGAGIAGVAPLPDARLFFKKEDYEEIPHDAMRKSIAKRLTSSKTLIPHFYLTVDCRIDGLLAVRAKLNEAAPKGGYKLSVNDFVVKASAMALMRVPEVNASWTDTAILRHKHADVGVAVALDFGLITPIVFRAEEKGLVAISGEIKSLAERAHQKTQAAGIRGRRVRGLQSGHVRDQAIHRRHQPAACRDPGGRCRRGTRRRRWRQG